MSQRADTPAADAATAATTDGGGRNRRTIAAAAAELATIEGLQGLSIGRLAEHIGMSKSGLYAHFGSKEELQLAAVEEAGEVFAREVVEPGMAGRTALDRAGRLCEAFLAHVERDVFPGGCFFAAAAAEFDTRPGRVKARVAEFQQGWMGMLADLVAEAQTTGELDDDDDPEQVAFELNAVLLAANATYLLQGTSAPFDRARQAVRRRLAGTRPARQ